MRTLPAAATAEIAKKLGTEPFNLIKVEWTEDGSAAWYSDKAFDGIQGRILELGDIDAVITLSKGQSTSASVVLDDTDGHIKAIFDTADIHQRPVTVYQHFGNLATANKFQIFKGRISSPIVWQEHSRQISFDVVTPTEDKLVGFSPEEGQFDFVSEEAIGKPWPLCFGSVHHVTATRIHQVAHGRLRTPLCIVDPMLAYKMRQIKYAFNMAWIARDFYAAAAVRANTIAALPSYIATAYAVAIANEDILLEEIEELELVVTEKDEELKRLKKPETEGGEAVENDDPRLTRLETDKAVAEEVVKDKKEHWAIVQKFKARVEKEAERAQYEHDVKTKAFVKQKEAIDQMRDLHTQYHDLQVELCRQQEQVAAMYRDGAPAVGVENGDIFPQGEPIDLEIKGLRFRGEFDNTRFKNITGPFPKYSDVALGGRESLTDACGLEPTLRGIDTFWLANDENIKGMWCLVASKLDGRYHLIQVEEQDGKKCTFKLVERRDEQSEDDGLIKRAEGVKFPVWKGPFGARPSGYVRPPDGIWGVVDKKFKHETLSKIRKFAEAAKDDDEKARKDAKRDISEITDPLDPNGFNLFRRFLSPQMMEIIRGASARINAREAGEWKDAKENQIDKVWDNWDEDAKPEPWDLWNKKLPSVQQIIESIVRDEDGEHYNIPINLQDEIINKAAYDRLKLRRRINAHHNRKGGPSIQYTAKKVGAVKRGNTKMSAADAALATRVVDNKDQHPTWSQRWLFDWYRAGTLQEWLTHNLNKDRELAAAAVEDDAEDFAQQLLDEDITPEEFWAKVMEKEEETSGRITEDEFKVLANLDFLLQYETVWDRLLVPAANPRNTYTLLGQDIKSIKAVAGVPLANWGHPSILFEEIPGSAAWCANAGTTVRAFGDEEEIFVANILPSTINAVMAYRTIENGETVLQQIPDGYYTANEAENLGPLVVTSLKFPRALSLLDDGWDDKVYVSLTSSVGNHVPDILQHIIETYTDNTVDATTFASVKADTSTGADSNYPANFALLTRRDVIAQINDIAWQARCAIFEKDEVFYLVYLPKEPTSVATLSETDVSRETFKLTTTETENLITEYTGTWKENYLPDVEENRVVFRHNVKKYGLQQEAVDFYIYDRQAMVEKSLTFWGIRAANVWKRLTFETFLTNLKLETQDCINLQFATDFITTTGAGVKCILEQAMYNTLTHRLKLTLWVPIRLGEMEQYTFAWPAGIAVTNTYPTDAEITAGYAGSGSIFATITGPVEGE